MFEHSARLCHQILIHITFERKLLHLASRDVVSAPLKTINVLKSVIENVMVHTGWHVLCIKFKVENSVRLPCKDVVTFVGEFRFFILTVIICWRCLIHCI